ncbi:MAG: DUF5658 family protein [Desulfotomaculaceae bacterium]|nr:DUF5658 family protein [Desulfotomaculaceae bacterium]
MLSYLLILLFCTMDHLFTYWEIGTGWAQELNPLLIGLMSLPVSASLPLRLSWILAGLLALRFLTRVRPVLVEKCLRTLVVVYGLVILYHGTVIYRILHIISRINSTDWPY